jgi:DNA polymerase-3 subunit gamma/tau
LSYLVLARKWRPQNFEQIVGQETITRTLTNALKTGRVAHAFLFSGARGVGKTTLARVLAKALNCEKGPTPEPCGVCGACREITAGSAVDVQEIDGASNNSVEDVRNLRETVKYMPASGRNKIYIIDEVHMLSAGAFNALLKTLEEPPAHVVFIFATTEPHKVPVTIHSRCQRYDFRRIPLALIQERLAMICAEEKLDAEPEALRVLAREAEGSMRDALSLLDQVASFAGARISREQVVQILGLAQRKFLTDLSAAVLRGDTRRALELVDELFGFGYDVRQFWRELIGHFRNLAVATLADAPERLMDLTEDELREVKTQAEGASLETLLVLFDLLVTGEQAMAHSNQPRLVLEMTVAKMAQLKPVVPIPEILAQLQELESRLAGAPASPPRATPPSSPAPDPPPAPTPAGPAPAPARSAPAAPAEAETAGGPWEQFLAYAEEHDSKLAALLRGGRFRGVTEREVRVAFAPDSLGLERLTSKGNAPKLNHLAAGFFGEGHRLVVSEESASEPTPAPRHRYLEADKLRREAMENPLVKAVAEILDGRVEEIKTK